MTTLTLTGELLVLPTFTDDRGSLTVIEEALPFPVRRFYLIHGTGRDAMRAGHRHRLNRQLLVCVHGSCTVLVDDGFSERLVTLDRTDLGLLLEPRDWHLIRDFSPDAVLLVAASEPYDPDDYIDEPYR